MLLTTALAVVAGAIVFAGTAGMGAFVFLTQRAVDWRADARADPRLHTSMNLYLIQSLRRLPP